MDNKPFDLGNGETTNLTCSIGFAPYPFYIEQPDLFNWEEVFDIADTALYAVKKSGRNGWIGLFSTENTRPDNLYQRTEKGKKKMLPNIMQLLDNHEINVKTSLHSIAWHKRDRRSQNNSSVKI